MVSANTNEGGQHVKLQPLYDIEYMSDVNYFVSLANVPVYKTKNIRSVRLHFSKYSSNNMIVSFRSNQVFSRTCPVESLRLYMPKNIRSMRPIGFETIRINRILSATLMMEVSM